MHRGPVRIVQTPVLGESRRFAATRPVDALFHAQIPGAKQVEIGPGGLRQQGGIGQTRKGIQRRMTRNGQRLVHGAAQCRRRKIRGAGLSPL